MKKIEEELADALGYRKEQLAYLAEKDAEELFKSATAVTRIVAAIEAHLEAALLSDDNRIAIVAKYIAQTKLNDLQLQEIDKLEKSMAQLWPEATHYSSYSTTDRSTEAKLLSQLRHHQELKKASEILKKRAVEALTSPSLYIRKLAKLILPKDVQKQIVKSAKEIEKKLPILKKVK